MTWQPPYLNELMGPDRGTLSSIFEDLVKFLQNPTFENGITIGDAREVYNPATGVKTRPATGAVPLGAIRQQVLTTSTAAWIVDTDTDMTLTDVPVIKNHTYAVHLHVPHVRVASVAATARWDFNLKINGTAVDRFAVLQPGVTGIFRVPLDATVYWKPTVTAASDDLLVSADEIIDGADITLEGAADAKRTLTVIDLGTL